MDDRTKRTEELFRLGLVVPRDEREAFLERHCADDPELLEELGGLLAQDDEGTKAYLESPLLSSTRNSETSRLADPAATPEVLVGARTERIGRYEVVRELGAGGMGSVYLAHQNDPVRRDVALKVVKLGMDTRRVVQRFDRERQALALMDHPNIARIFDGGTTESGRPYFVMEYVPGVPLTDYCDAHKLKVRERLELFVRVCEAVQHAHSKGVIHRDLKPTNVLVSDRDGRPEPKVIDFGIARAVEAAGFRAEEDLLNDDTRSNEVVGTFAYMSPEQADPEADDIDERADVFALGVLLYELLTGGLPIDEGALRGKAPSEVSRILSDTDPQPPSTRITRLGALSSRVADRRGGLEPRALARYTSGDLDWITLRAMDPECERRYPTASALAADVRRHLRDEPVQAGPPSPIYRARKFVRRHRIGVAAAAAIVLTVASGTAGTVLGFSEASDEARAARAAEREAVAAANTARRALAAEAESREYLENYNEALLDLVDLSNPEVALRSDESAVSLLIDLRRKILDIFDEDPRGEARMRVRVGRALRMRGELELAREDLTRARHLQDSNDAPKMERLETRREIHALIVDTQGYADFTEGLSAAEFEVELLSEIDGDLGSASAELLEATKEHLLLQIRPSLAAMEKALTGVPEPEARRAHSLAADLCGLTGAYLGLHLAFGEGEPLLRRALTLREEIQGPTDPGVVHALDELVLHLNLQGHANSAELAVRERAPAFRERFASGHWLRAVVDSLHGECLSLVGRRAEALPLLEAAHESILKDRGPSSRVAVHAALRLREHYARSEEAYVPPELNDAVASPLALARDKGGAWLRTARELGADEEVTSALTELFVTDSTPKGPQPTVSRAASVLTEFISRRDERPFLGDLLSRAILIAEHGRTPEFPAPDPGWREAVRVAEAREALSRAFGPTPLDYKAPTWHPTPDVATPSPAPAPSDEPAIDDTEVAALTAEAVPEETELESVEEELLEEEPTDPALEYSAEELILISWVAAADPNSGAQIYALALEASDMAMQLCPEKPEYVVVHAFALARLGAWKPALDELKEFENSVGDIGFIGHCARALAHHESGQDRAAVGALIEAIVSGFLYGGLLPPKSVEVIIELERLLID